MTNSYPSGSPGVPDLMPTGAPVFVPRRSSYASVVSGTASGALYQSQPTRSGAFSHLLNQNDFSYDPSYQAMSGYQRHDSRTYDMDLNTNGSSHGRSGSWGRSGQLHQFSSAFAGLVNGSGGFGGNTADQFFIPSYLKGSRYVQRLEEAHKAKVAAQKDGQSAPSSQPGSLSTSASSVNLHAKMGSSYRGMSYDIIEKAPPIEDETLTPLPSKWNTLDKYGGLEVLSDGTEVKFSGAKAERDRDHEACAIRADHPMPSQCGIYYYEVHIMSRKREESSIALGFSTKNVPLSRPIGWEPESYGYHGDDGNTFGCQTSGKPYATQFTTGDTIGCGVNFRTGCAFFTKNGQHLNAAFHDIKETKGKLFPSISMKKSGEHIRVNFGQRPFLFDIDGMMSHRNYTMPPSAAFEAEETSGHGTNSQEPGSSSSDEQRTAEGSSNLIPPRYMTTFRAEESEAPSSTTVPSSGHTPDNQHTARNEHLSEHQGLPEIEQSFENESSQNQELPPKETFEAFATFEQSLAAAREQIRQRQLDDPATSSGQYIAYGTRRTPLGYETTVFSFPDSPSHIDNTAGPISPSDDATVLDSDHSPLWGNQDGIATYVNGQLEGWRRHVNSGGVVSPQQSVPPAYDRLAFLPGGYASSQAALEQTNPVIVPNAITDLTSSVFPPISSPSRTVVLRYTSIANADRLFDDDQTRGRRVVLDHSESLTFDTRETAPTEALNDDLEEGRLLIREVRSPNRPIPYSSRRYPGPNMIRNAIRSRDTRPLHDTIPFRGNHATRAGIRLLSAAASRSSARSRSRSPSPQSYRPSQAMIESTGTQEHQPAPVRPSAVDSIAQSRDRQDLSTGRDSDVVEESGLVNLNVVIITPSALYGQRASLVISPGTYSREQDSRPSPDTHQHIATEHLLVNEPNSRSQASSPSPQQPSTSQSGDPGADSNDLSVFRVSLPPESPGSWIALAEAQSRMLYEKFGSCSSLAKICIQSMARTRANCDVQTEKLQLRVDIEATSTAKLSPPMSETELVQAFVLQYLVHDGYSETARAFAKEVYDEKLALSLDPNEVVRGFDVKEDEDAGHRQKIRTAVLEGDIDKALKHTNAYYPNVLQGNEHVYFRLKCRKFIEMVKLAADLQTSSQKINAKKSNGHNGDWYDDIINHDMELDDHQNSNNYDRMDTEEVPENHSEQLRLLEDTLAYGRELQAEFKNDPRREVKKGLDDIFALMAYPDPMNVKEVSHLLDTAGRMAVAEELNSAILLSLGKSSSAAIERLCQQTTVLLEDIREGGGPGSLVNIDDFVRPGGVVGHHYHST